MSARERAELQGRVRVALDRVLGPGTYQHEVPISLRCLDCNGALVSRFDGGTATMRHAEGDPDPWHPVRTLESSRPVRSVTVHGSRHLAGELLVRVNRQSVGLIAVLIAGANAEVTGYQARTLDGRELSPVTDYEAARRQVIYAYVRGDIGT